MSDDTEGSAAMLGSLDAIKGVDAGPEAAERLFLGKAKHDGSPEPTALLPNTVHAGCRSRKSDAGTGDTVEQRWISVKERLPQPHFSVICFLNGRASEMQCTRHHYRLRWYYPASGEYDDGVTHWMPLPAPPTDAK